MTASRWRRIGSGERSGTDPARQEMSWRSPPGATPNRAALSACAERVHELGRSQRRRDHHEDGDRLQRGNEDLERAAANPEPIRRSRSPFLDGEPVRIDPVLVLVRGDHHETPSLARANNGVSPARARAQERPETATRSACKVGSTRTVENQRAFARPGRQGCPRSSALRGLDSGLASAGAPVSAAVGCRDQRGHRSKFPCR